MILTPKDKVLAWKVVWDWFSFPATFLDDTKDSIDELIKKPNWWLSFKENISLIDKSFRDNWLDFFPVTFDIWWNFFSDIWENEKSLKILAYAAYVTNLTIWEVLELFWENYLQVLKNPDDTNNYKLLRLLSELPKNAYVRDVVLFWASPLKSFRV